MFVLSRSFITRTYREEKNENSTVAATRDEVAQRRGSHNRRGGLLRGS